MKLNFQTKLKAVKTLLILKTIVIPKVDFLSGVAKLMPNNTIITTIKLIAIVTKSTRLMLMIAK